MPATVTLTGITGRLAGQEFLFDERMTCVVGRASDCGLPIPVDDELRGVSRHHRLLDVNPPDIRIRDFGSLNGTFVNGKKIGERTRGQGANQAPGAELPELVDLEDAVTSSG